MLKKFDDFIWKTWFVIEQGTRLGVDLAWRGLRRVLHRHDPIECWCELTEADRVQVLRVQVLNDKLDKLVINYHLVDNPDCCNGCQACPPRCSSCTGCGRDCECYDHQDEHPQEKAAQR